MPKFGPTSTNMPAIAVASPTRKVGVTFCFQRTHPARVTKMGARFASSVEFATDVHTIDQCQTPRSAAKKSPARMIGVQTGVRSLFVTKESDPGLLRRVDASHSHKNGTARAVRQKALATGPVSERRTKIGANAIAVPPRRRHAKATVTVRGGFTGSASLQSRHEQGLHARGRRARGRLRGRGGEPASGRLEELPHARRLAAHAR